MTIYHKSTAVSPKTHSEVMDSEFLQCTHGKACFHVTTLHTQPPTPFLPTTIVRASLAELVDICQAHTVVLTKTL